MIFLTGNTLYCMRNKYIDVLKGILILFVVFYHILWCGVGYKSSPTAVLFHTTCMQAFFFVSGYLSFKVIKKHEQKIYIRKSIGKKAKNVLVPTILMFLFSIWFFNLDIVEWLNVGFKNGYWFTYVLFVFYVLLYIVVLPLQKEMQHYRDIVVLLGSLVLMVGSAFTERMLGTPITNLLSLKLIFYYWFYFIAGYYWKKYSDRIEVLINKNIVRTLIILVAIIPLHLLQDSAYKYLLECIVSISRVAVVFTLVTQSSYMGEEHLITNQLAKFGRHSLEIYFLHFYFIFGMPMVYDLLTKQHDMYVVRGAGSTLTLEVLIIVPVAIGISYVCMIVRKFFDFAPPLSRLFLGPIPEDNN